MPCTFFLTTKVSQDCCRFIFLHLLNYFCIFSFKCFSSLCRYQGFKDQDGIREGKLNGLMLKRRDFFFFYYSSKETEFSQNLPQAFIHRVTGKELAFHYNSQSRLLWQLSLLHVHHPSLPVPRTHPLSPWYMYNTPSLSAPCTHPLTPWSMYNTPLSLLHVHIPSLPLCSWHASMHKN